MTMQLAQVLADLSSLSLCGTPEALALVSQHSTSTHPTEPTSSTDTDTEKTDALRRAKDLVRLHADMKARMSRHVDVQTQTQRQTGGGGVNVNVDADLMRLRGEVRKVREMLAGGGALD